LRLNNIYANFKLIICNPFLLTATLAGDVPIFGGQDKPEMNNLKLILLQDNITKRVRILQINNMLYGRFMKEEFEEQVRNSLTEYAKSRMCLVGSIGTGNLVSINGKKYIITCKHVADDFFKMESSVITVKSNKKIDHDNLNYVGCSDLYDTAVIEILNDTIQEIFYEHSDFHFIDDFREYNFNEDDLHLCGFPFSLRYENDSSRWRFWFSYLTIPILNKTEKDFIYCDYPMDAEADRFKGNFKTTLPPANGLSGSFVHLIGSSNISKNDIWTLRFVKVIAMQISWNTKSHLKCVNISHIKELIKDMPI